MADFEALVPSTRADAIPKRFAKLETEMAELRSARRTASTTISGTGSKLRVDEGAEFEVMHDTLSNVAVLRVNKDSQDNYVITIRRDDGTLAFTTVSTVAGTPIQYWALCDRQNRIIFSDDALSGKGIGRPWIPIHLYPFFHPIEDLTGYRRVNAGVAATYEGHASIQHPYLAIKGVWGRASGANASATYSLRVNGIEIGNWTVTDTLESSAIRVFDCRNFVGQDFAKVELAITSSTGPGTIAFQILGLWGRQT